MRHRHVTGLALKMWPPLCSLQCMTTCVCGALSATTCQLAANSCYSCDAAVCACSQQLLQKLEAMAVNA
jgi:hypothetical protein